MMHRSVVWSHNSVIIVDEVFNSTALLKVIEFTSEFSLFICIVCSTGYSAWMFKMLFRLRTLNLPIE